MANLNLKIDVQNEDELNKYILDEVAEEIFNQSQQNIVDESIIDEGTLLKSGSLNFVSTNKMQISYDAVHADIVEFGRLPGKMPPIGDENTGIQGWVRRKLGIKDPKESRQIAWAIATDIKKNGLIPRPYLTPALEKVKNERIL